MTYAKRFLVNTVVVATALTSISGIGFAGDAASPRVNVPFVSHRSLTDGDSILNDIYVKLYLARLRRAKLAVEREKQNLAVEVKKRDRAEGLYRSNAIAAEELENNRRFAEVAAIKVQEAEASAEEAETFVDIAVSRISIGLEMPICAEIR